MWQTAGDRSDLIRTLLLHVGSFTIYYANLLGLFSDEIVKKHASSDHCQSSHIEVREIILHVTIAYNWYGSQEC